MAAMITNIIPVAVGNALRIFLQPPASAICWSLLRKQSDVFTDVNDPNAAIVFVGGDQTVVLDVRGLANGTAYFYAVFYFDGANWTLDNVVSATPAVTYSDRSVDVLSVVRERLALGLQNEIVIKTLTPARGVIAVLNAPPVFEETSWPVVTVHVSSDASGDRAIGELMIPDEFDSMSDRWSESQGWLARVQLAIVGWSKNADERIALRKALRKIVIGNLDVFDAFGMINIDFSQQDIDELSAYPAPVYQSLCTFSCEAPAGIADTVAPFTGDLQSTMTPVF